MNRSRQIHIFATRSDLLPGVREAEKQLKLTYFRSDGLRREPTFERFESLTDWTDLGKNNTGDHLNGYRFMILPQGEKPKVRRIPQEEGGVRYALDQRLNPDSVHFLPGGIYEKQPILVCGHIGTASESRVSINLFKAFARLVTKGFEQIGSYRIGPEAAQLMNQGYRMVTISLVSSPTYDLRR